MVRKLDKLGRIVVPIEFRKINNWKERQEIEIIENNDEIILRKYDKNECKVCGNKTAKTHKYCSNCGTKL